MKFLRIIRFDSSDDNVYSVTAKPNEWAISGGFSFSDMDEGELTGKIRQAFANGFLGLPSFGRSTFVASAEITEDEKTGIEDVLAEHFFAEWGAPTREEALKVAREETRFVTDLCEEHPVNTIFTVHREIEQGDIREEFRTVQAPSGDIHARVWDVVEDNG